MGLDDILPDEADKRGAKTQETEEKEEFHKKVTGPQGKEKKFDKERWKEIREIIDREFEDSLPEVMNNYSRKKRYEVVHQAALVVDEQKELKETERQTTTRCPVCGNDCSDHSVEIEGTEVCIQHPAIQVRKALDGE